MTGADDPPLVDGAVLADLDGILGEAFVAECLAVYLADAERLRTELEQALAAEDAARVTRTAHALGSSSATVGAKALSVFCRGVERGERSADTGSELADRFGQTVKALEAERDRRSPGS